MIPIGQGRGGVAAAEGDATPRLIALRAANDAFRKRPVGLASPDGRWMFTAAAAQAIPVDRIIEAVQRCERMMTNAGDPDCEHLNGLAFVGDVALYWNIECYTDHLCTASAGDPLRGCYRVLQVMHGDEMKALMALLSAGGAVRHQA